MRIAFFGGSFDPPHVGHLRVAHAAAERLRLDRILMAPVASQPLKLATTRPLPTSYEDRLAMVELLLADDARERALLGQAYCDLEPSDLDAPRADNKPNYTYDTLLRMRARMKSEDELFVLLGADSFLSMRHWYRAAELLLLANWIVAARPGFSFHQIDDALPPAIRPGSAQMPLEGHLVQQLATADGRTTTMHLLADLQEEASATEVRAAIAAAGELPPLGQRLVSPSVAAYIESRGLYRGTSRQGSGKRTGSSMVGKIEDDGD